MKIIVGLLAVGFAVLTRARVLIPLPPFPTSETAVFSSDLSPDHTPCRYACSEHHLWHCVNHAYYRISFLDAGLTHGHAEKLVALKDAPHRMTMLLFFLLHGLHVLRIPPQYSRKAHVHWSMVNAGSLLRHQPVCPGVRPVL